MARTGRRYCGRSDPPLSAAGRLEAAHLVGDLAATLAPGTRIVTNRFAIEGWEADEVSRLGGDSEGCCTARLHVVPAPVAGTWRLSDARLVLEQTFQMLYGTLWLDGISASVDGRVRGNEVSFTALGDEYVGCVRSDSVSGTINGGAGGAWAGVRVKDSS